LSITPLFSLNNLNAAALRRREMRRKNRCAAALKKFVDHLKIKFANKKYCFTFAALIDALCLSVLNNISTAFVQVNRISDIN
jgi:hypothetical protein